MLKALIVVQSYSLKKYLDIFLRSIVSYSIEKVKKGTLLMFIFQYIFY